MSNKLTIYSTSITAFALVACGGGGGGSPMPNPIINEPVVSNIATQADPNSLVTTTTQTADLRWGTPATPTVLSRNDNVQAQIKSVSAKIITRTSYGYTYPTITTPINLNENAPLDMSTSLLQGVWITSDVKAAWAQGWTGAGVKIGILDDFTADKVSEFLSVPVQTGCANISSTLATCSQSATAYFRQTHGDQVAMIAGGSRSSLPGAYIESGGYATTGESGTYSMRADLSITLSSPQYGIAKDAQVLRNDFLTYQSNTNGLFSVLKGWGIGADTTSAKYRELKVVNLSIGNTQNNIATNTATYDTQLAYANSSTTPDAVFVKAAGNSSCVVSSTNCDPMNAVFHNSAPFKNKSILVGALTQSGGQIANYSNTAGAYADRFVVADGRGIQEIDGTYAQGTSFAAPRVSGYAAIVRQKFPNLNAASTANIILDTAMWNPAWGNKSPTTQATYGQGEASLGRALAPVGLLR